MGAFGSVTVILDCLGAIFFPPDLVFGATLPVALGEIDDTDFEAALLLRDGPLIDTLFGCFSSTLGEGGRFFPARIFFPAAALGRTGAFFVMLTLRSAGLNLWANIFL